MTTLLLVLIVAFSVFAFYNPNLMQRLIFNPFIIDKRREWYRFISSAFIHADWLHLAVNAFVMYSFGPVVEYYYTAAYGDKGWYYYLLLFVGAAVTAVIPTYVKYRNDPGYNALGASGAVSGIVFAAIIFNPWQKLYLFAIIGIPGIVFAIGYLVYSYYMGRRSADNVNHDAHFWGGVFGFVFTILLQPKLIVYFIQKLFGMI